MAPRMRRRITSTKREELEKQQRELAKAIVRPFEVLSGLPVSFSSPQASDQHALKNPLTVKDSGVFYRSLMKSRYTYVHICPMFTLYWIKQSSYAKKLAEQDKPLPKSARDENIIGRSPLLNGDVSARDVMVKLCDASITLGPHDFEIRLFIAKDERSEKNNNNNKKKDKEKEIKLPENTSNNSNSSNTNELNKVKNNIPTPEKIPINTTIDPSLDKKNKEEVINSNKKVKETSKNNESEKIEHNDPESDINIQKTKSNDETKIPKEENNDPNNNDKNYIESNSDSQKNPNSEVLGGSQKSTAPDSTNATQSNTVDSSVVKTNQTPQPGLELTTQPISSTPPVPPAPPAPPAPATPDATNMQSIENSIMISNLNTIARTDTSLNALMKIVASGKASPQEIIKFQGYIKKAREMGPQPHHAYLFAQNPGYYPYGNNLQMLKGKKLKEKKPPKEKKLKSKTPKDQKLTAFQEKYLTDATILFEFVENPNVRFVFPKNAICEVIDPEKKQEINEDDQDIGEVKDILISFLWVHNQTEIDEYEKKLAEYNKIMEEREQKENPKPQEKKVEEQKERNLSEQNQPAEKSSAKNSVEEKQENQSSEKQDKTIDNTNEDNINTNNNNIDNATITIENNTVKGENTEEIKKIIPERKNTRRRKYTAPKRSSIRKLELPLEPEKRFTALSFTIHNVPLRFVPIVTNSFNPVEKVQNYMSEVIKNGTRTPNFYLWYQVDGKLDEELAENIRIQLNQEEKKLTGIPIANLSNSKKRTKKDKETKQKKQKIDNAKSVTNDSISGQYDSVQPSSNQLNSTEVQDTRNEVPNSSITSEKSIKTEPLVPNPNITT